MSFGHHKYICYKISIFIIYYFSISVAFATGDYGAGNGPIALTDVTCEGDEGFLLNCTFSVNTDSLSHAGDIGVKCFNEPGTHTHTHTLLVND